MFKRKSLRSAIVCDFDGCLCYQDVFDEIIDHFTGTIWRRFGISYEKGEISHSEMTRRAIGLLKCSPKELDRFLSQKIEIRKGYKEFHAFCKQLKIPFVIVSTGCDYYIKSILNKELLHFLKPQEDLGKISEDYVCAIANHLVFNAAKEAWEVSFPWNNETRCFCRCSPCKRKIVQHLKEAGIEFVIGIGDGLSDRCMAREVDLVFARSFLKDYCKTNEISFYEFDNFEEIFKVIEKFLGGSSFV